MKSLRILAVVFAASAAACTPVDDTTSEETGSTSSALAGSDTLLVNETLPTNASLVSTDQRSSLVAQGDGNLVLYHDGRAIWATSTSASNAALTMQGDGNAVLVAGGGQALWSSHTANHGPAHLTVQTDCNVVVYSDSTGAALWASNTTSCGVVPACNPPSKACR